MKISLIIPTNNFLERLVPELEKLGAEVEVNTVSPDSDVMIGMSQSQNGNIGKWHKKCPHVPLITYNWDWYDHIDKESRPDWQEFIGYMRDSLEVWSASEDTAIKCERDTGIKSPLWLYAYILPEEWRKLECRDEGYAIQASRQDAYKRFDWFQEQTKELNIPSKSFHPATNPRPEYIDAIRNCSFLVVSSIEESLGTLSAMEAGFCYKPILIADFPGAKEVWGKSKGAMFFNRHSIGDYRAKLALMWSKRGTEEFNQMGVANRMNIEKNFLPEHFAKKMYDRLQKIL